MVLQRLLNMKQEREDDKARELRENGRPQGAFMQAVGREALQNGRPWPLVLEDPKTGTTTVPQSFEGLLAFVASWDSLLLDEEMVAFKELVNQLVPAGQKYQQPERERRAAEKRMWEHVKEHDPETWDRMQGWKV